MKNFFGQLLHWVIVIGFVGLGVAGLRWGISEIRLSNESRGWPQANGYIRTSQINIARSGKGTNYWPVIQYEYSVNGVSYQNNTILFGQNGSASQTDAKSTVAEYYIGRQVKFFYNPSSPNISCLKPGQIYWATYLSIPLCTLFILFGLFLMLVWHSTNQINIGFSKKRTSDPT